MLFLVQLESGLPLSSAVRLALPIKRRFFMEAVRPCFVDPEARPPKSKVELPSEADPYRIGERQAAVTNTHFLLQESRP
jgi:hypothetical protein